MHIKYKSALSTLCVAAVYVGVLGNLATPILAQTPLTPAQVASYWERIHKVDDAVQTGHLVWEQTRVKQPNPTLDPEKSAASAMEQLRKQGRPDAEVESFGEAIRQSTKNDAAGYQQTAKMTWSWHDAEIRCDMLESPPLIAGADTTPAHFINYYDGTNAINLEGMGKEVPTFAVLTRQDRAEVLPNCGKEFADKIFFMGAPLSAAFSSQNSSLRVENDAIIVEKNDKNDGVASLLRMTLSSQTLRPIMAEILNPVSKRLRARYLASDFRTLAPSGISFPHRIDVSYGDNAILEEYRLSEVSLNDLHALPAILNPLVRGVTVDDGRFKDQAPIRYKVNQGMLSDEDVLQLMDKDKNEEAAAMLRQLVTKILTHGLL